MKTNFMFVPFSLSSVFVLLAVVYLILISIGE